MIPVNDIVTIVKSAGLDDWGDPITGSTITVKGRVSESTEKIVSANGDEVNPKGIIYFIGFVDIKYTDVVKFTKSNGVEVEEHPLTINFKKDLGGTILITKVVI